MTQNQIDKCLDFAEGKKGKFTILMTKKPEFPENLLTGTEKQCAISSYIEQGLTTREIADVFNCTQPNIVEHMRQYRKGKEFYYEWCEFWEASEQIRSIPIASAFANILNEEEMKKYQNKGIVTVGDYLRLSVTMKTTKFCGMLGENEADKSRKEALFNHIRKMCHEVLTVNTVQ